jgi:hypothetical protein
LLVSPVVLVFVVTSALAWDRLIDAPENAVFAGGLERAWVDASIPDEARVTKLYVETEACPTTAITRHALFLTEAFNASVDRAARLGSTVPDGLPTERVDVGPGGVLLLSPGNPLEAEYVYTQPGIELDGERITSGTRAELELWRIGGPVAVVGADSNGDVRTRDCA